MYCQPLLACQLSVDRSDVILMLLPPYCKEAPLPGYSQECLLVVQFASFTVIRRGVDLYLLNLGGVLSASWTRMLVSFPRLGKF